MSSLFKTQSLSHLKKYLSFPFAFQIGVFLLILPFLISSVCFFFEQKKLHELHERISLIQAKQMRKEFQIKTEEKILNQIGKSKSGYLKEVLESMVFLGSERQKWQLFSQQMEHSHPMKQRVSFLEQGTNKLEFVQTDVRKNELFQETEENQKNAVELSDEDLKTLLCYIEGAQIHPYTPKERAPQILLRSFELEKKNIPGISDKTYHIKMQLIKREALVK